MKKKIVSNDRCFYCCHLFLSSPTHTRFLFFFAIIKILSSFKAFFNAVWWIDSGEEKKKSNLFRTKSIIESEWSLLKGFSMKNHNFLNNVILMKRKFRCDIIWLMICMIYSGLLGVGRMDVGGKMLILKTIFKDTKSFTRRKVLKGKFFCFESGGSELEEL